MIVIDSREASRHKPLVNKLKKKLGEEYVSVEALSVGDFIVSGQKGTIVYERKTVPDFCGSWASKRIFPQLNNLADLAKNNPDVTVCLLLEGHIDVAVRYHGWTVPAISGIIGSIPRAWKLPVIPSMNQEMTTYILISNHKNLGATKEKIHLDWKPKAENLDSVALRVLGAYPGIGAVKADKLLRKFGNVGSFLFWYVHLAPEEVDGILSKTDLQKFEEVLNHKYKQNLELKTE